MKLMAQLFVLYTQRKVELALISLIKTVNTELLVKELLCLPDSHDNYVCCFLGLAVHGV